MTGNSQQYQLNQTRANQTAQSYNLASGQEAVLNMQAQDPNANLKAIAAQREQIWAEHTERMKLIESTYQNDSMNLQLSYGANVTGALAGMFKNMLGESSSAYRILYESQRAFALAQAGMNMWKAASDAYANEPGTWYQKRQQQRSRQLNQVHLYLSSKLQPRKDLRMAVIPVMALNTLQQGLCIKAKSYGRKKISNAGVVLALLKACVKVNQVVMLTVAMYQTIKRMQLQQLESIDNLMRLILEELRSLNLLLPLSIKHQKKWMLPLNGMVRS